MNTTPLLNRSSVKKLALEFSQKNRAGKFTRVSKDFLERVNRKLAELIASEVQAHPSVGKTLQ
jgi:hypothetical protein